jgi:hypothetical protein
LLKLSLVLSSPRWGRIINGNIGGGDIPGGGSHPGYVFIDIVTPLFALMHQFMKALSPKFKAYFYKNNN